MRVINVDGQVWNYGIGRGSTVLIGQGVKFVVSNAEVKGIPESVFERGQHKRTSDGMVTPSEVAALIRKKRRPHA